ncbi:TDP-N-acetylfucosamine:lipid II N-acetylfucosaminyltransferase [Vibrio gangliei]|uniref:TDP-N-acetylfucosamine:lipid II N-acetylfucosaminyltransferase n=1 Tax=Vibrio gangliei TaxID=2077090 RepID=UPI000D0194A8|nr:TDP-N-acetylfucosamine:lipid II N-acetylfucosaminyltransferase [Vibrio gangliei]
MKILHISRDEKFIDKAIETFKSFDEINNTFIILSKGLKYISNKDDVVLYSFPKLIKSCLLGEFYKYDVIIFHGLTTEHKIILRLLHKRHGQKIVWIGFGFDYYNYSQQKVITDNYVNPLNSKGRLRLFCVKFIKKIINLDGAHYKIDYFSPVIKSEYSIFKKLMKLEAKYIDWDYGSTFSTLNSLKNKKIFGDGILLGNSATETNNHISALNLIKDIVGDKKIIMPLSYGSNDYKEWLKNEIKKFDLNFNVIDSFMPIDDYFNMLLSCQYVVMNHIRQQALGNIIVMLSLGAKVFLKKDNPLYFELKNLGFIIYLIDDIQYDSFMIPLSTEDMTNNRKLAYSLYNDEIIKEKTLKFIKEIKHDLI